MAPDPVPEDVARAETPAPPGGGGQLLSWLVGSVVLAVALGLIWLGDSNVPAPIGRGARAPDFDLALHGGASEGRFVLSEHRGRIVLVNFWATWCKPCEDEMPSMERLYRELAPEGFELVAVSVDEKPEDIEAFRKRMGVSFPIALDPAQEVSRLYQTQGFPESLLIDRDGKVLERYVGPREWSIYAARIRSLLAAGS
jgi:cytochrome c biogenesis protein CcmG/thiol:disulfide interchange protein DsbE